MSRKDYKAIAAALAAERELAAQTPEGWQAWQNLVNRMIVLFYSDNANFKAGKFLDACLNGE